MAKAIAKFIRMSPRKLRRVINIIRGMDAINARTTLKFLPHRAAHIIEKVLVSAISNAKENDKLSLEELRVTKAYVDQAVTLRRWRAMSRGRGYPILKRTSHITVEVGQDAKLANQVVEAPKKLPKYKVAKKEDKHEHSGGVEHKHSVDTEVKTAHRSGKAKGVNVKAQRVQKVKKDKKDVPKHLEKEERKEK